MIQKCETIDRSDQGNSAFHAENSEKAALDSVPESKETAEINNNEGNLNGVTYSTSNASDDNAQTDESNNRFTSEGMGSNTDKGNIDSGTDNQNDSEADGESNGENQANARYDAMMKDDLARLKASFAECASLNSVAELSDPIRYAALRDMGLCAEEAYAAVSYRKKSGYDNRTHLKSAAQMASAAPSQMMTASELEGARELFGNLSDTEIASLYRRACGMKR